MPSWKVVEKWVRGQTVCVKALMMELVNLESDRNVYSCCFPQSPTLSTVGLLVPLTTSSLQTFRPKGGNSTPRLLVLVLPGLRTAFYSGFPTPCAPLKSLY